MSGGGALALSSPAQILKPPTPRRSSPSAGPFRALIPNPRRPIESCRRARIHYHCSAGAGGGGRRTPGPSSEENESRVVLDAFFLGKAFAEALNERVGSAVGELLSVVGQWQAEQQKQVQDFQEEVLERAKRAKEKAAIEVQGEQGVLSKSPPIPSDDVAPATTPSSLGPTTEDPFQEMLKD